MKMNFIGALVFALVFFGIWSLRDSATVAGQTRTIYLLCAFVFIVLAWALSRVFV